MKGIILAGGHATRLRPLTSVTNKHLLPVFDRPMIFYPLQRMAEAGIEEVLITTNPEHVGHFVHLLRSGKDFGLRISYDVQERAGGLSQAVALAEHFARGERVLVILGDNIFWHNLRPAVEAFLRQERGAKVFAKSMPTECQHYGVIELANGLVVSIEEKPKIPKSDLAQTGIYMYDTQVFDFIKTLKPSARGELEITDLNNCYLKQGSLTCEVMDSDWIDAGASIEEYWRANQLVVEAIKSGRAR